MGLARRGLQVTGLVALLLLSGPAMAGSDWCAFVKLKITEFNHKKSELRSITLRAGIIVAIMSLIIEPARRSATKKSQLISMQTLRLGHPIEWPGDVVRTNRRADLLYAEILKEAHDADGLRSVATLNLSELWSRAIANPALSTSDAALMRSNDRLQIIRLSNTPGALSALASGNGRFGAMLVALARVKETFGVDLTKVATLQVDAVDADASTASWFRFVYAFSGARDLVPGTLNQYASPRHRLLDQSMTTLLGNKGGAGLVDSGASLPSAIDAAAELRAELANYPDITADMRLDVEYIANLVVALLTDPYSSAGSAAAGP